MTDPLSYSTIRVSLDNVIDFIGLKNPFYSCSPLETKFCHSHKWVWAPKTECVNLPWTVIFECGLCVDAPFDRKLFFKGIFQKLKCVCLSMLYFCRMCYFEIRYHIWMRLSWNWTEFTILPLIWSHYHTFSISFSIWNKTHIDRCAGFVF